MSNWLRNAKGYTLHATKIRNKNKNKNKNTKYVSRKSS